MGLWCSVVLSHVKPPPCWPGRVLMPISWRLWFYAMSCHVPFDPWACPNTSFMKDCGVKSCQAMPLLAWACPDADCMKGFWFYAMSCHVLFDLWACPKSSFMKDCGGESCQAMSSLAWACPNADSMKVLVLCHVVPCPFRSPGMS